MADILAARVAATVEELGVYARGINPFNRTAEKAIALVADLMAEVGRLRAALDKLARLGNEPHYGNSVGNDIARAALAGKDGG